MDMTVTVTGTIEITPWILGWGDAVEVLAPPELRDKIAEIGEGMTARNRGAEKPIRPPRAAASRKPGKPRRPSARRA